MIHDYTRSMRERDRLAVKRLRYQLIGAGVLLVIALVMTVLQ